MKYYSLPILLAISLMLGSCCDPCETSYIGEFLLDEETDNWIGYATIPNRLFTSSQGRSTTLTHSTLQSGREELFHNCTLEERCGSCCEFRYEATFYFVELTSTNGEYDFDISLRKDFLRNDPLQDPATIKDYLSISFNNRLTGELFDVPDVSLTDVVTLNGKTFSNVWKYEASTATDPTSKEPVAFYFQATEGIIGFKLLDGEEWSLSE